MNCELLSLSPQEERSSKETRGRQGEEDQIENAKQKLEPKKRPSCSSRSALSILFSLPCKLCTLSSGVSSALALDPHSLSCVLSAWSIVLSCCVGVIQNVITSHQFTRLYGWHMRMMPCGHGPNAQSQEITIHITTVGLAQARPNYSPFGSRFLARTQVDGYMYHDVLTCSDSRWLLYCTSCSCR